MPPKLKGWKSVPTTAAQKDLTAREFLVQQIVENNLLALPHEEIQSMVDVVVKAKDEKEVHDWFQTLMLGETVAQEFLKRRATRVVPGAVMPSLPSSASNVPKAKQNLPSAEEQPKTPSVMMFADVEGSSTSSSPKPTTASPPSKTTAPSSSTGGRGKSTNSKNKFSLQSTKSLSQSASALVPGVKFECGCFATTHGFLSNCGHCGRIFCEQESNEICYSCARNPLLLHVPSEMLMDDGAAEQEKLLSDKSSTAAVAGYRDALQKRDQLLKFAQEKVKRTSVVDDQAGTAPTVKHAWMSKQERDSFDEEQRRKVQDMHKKSGAYKIHLDIVNNSVCLGAASMPPAHSETSLDTNPPESPAPQNSSSFPPSECEGSSKLTGPEEMLDELVEESRIVALPTLLQKIWYASPPDPNPQNDEKRKAHSNSVLMSQRLRLATRLQNDYYEEDQVRWEILQQEKSRPTHDCAEEASEGILQSTLCEDVNEIDFDAGRLSKTSAAVSSQARADPEPLPLSKEIVALFVSSAATSSPQDKIPQEFRRTDRAMCLSLHQPYASLLVAGIKRHEGRGWPTDFRGKLWIHAAAAKPINTQEVESQYTPFLETKKFPSNYPTGCLLGYIYVVDCLDKPSYQAKYEPRERQEDSEFSWICLPGKCLPFPLQMSGKHKIYGLEKKIWLAARKQLGEETSQ